MSSEAFTPRGVGCTVSPDVLILSPLQNHSAQLLSAGEHYHKQVINSQPPPLPLHTLDLAVQQFSQKLWTDSPVHLVRVVEEKSALLRTHQTRS